MTTKLNLNDFNIENQNILKKSLKKNIKKNNLIKKLQINLTEEEYSKFYGKEFLESGLTHAGYARMKLKKIKFI